MEEQFEYYCEDELVHFKYAQGEPAVKEQEFHDYHEIVYFMKGECALLSRNIQQSLRQGSLVVIPKENFHRFFVTAPESYVRCILGFRDDPLWTPLLTAPSGGIRVIAAPHRRILSAFEHLIEVAMSTLPERDKLAYIRASVTSLALYLKMEPSRAIYKNVTLSPTVSRALALIDRKYAEPLTVASLAEELYVSPSTLSHKFSRELNISVYRYITKKRLSVAHELIVRGEPLTAAALSAGFTDYSCFYRLYKKYYCD